MCGVFGWILRNGSFTDHQVAQAKRAVASLAHRGPDHQGIWQTDQVFMGHRRLSILDLSDAASQPFEDVQGRYVLSFNGEIYNYLELRDELAAAGWVFRTRSDTEVLLAALTAWGEDALPRLDGMFAGALHDRLTGRHLLFRDPLGQKPLYWCETGAGVLYASELRALLALDAMRWRLDRPAFYRFLANGYYGLADSPVEGVRKLLPGCVLDIGGGRPAERSYWTSMPGDAPHPRSQAEALEHLDRLLRVSCERTMRSDVPYGVFLSGGIDSSLVLDYCHELNPDVASFSVGMSERDFDESGKAERVRRHLGVRNHHVFTMSEASVLSALRSVLDTMDEPHADPGYVNSYFLAQSARPHITVGLAGDGGDELFGGYAPLRALPAARLVKRLPGVVASAAKRVARLLPGSDRYMGLQFVALAFLQGFPARDFLRLPLWLAAADPEELAELAGRPGEFFARSAAPGSLLEPYAPLEAQVAARSDLQQALHFYQRVFLPEFVCMHTDRAAMQHSLEVRSPLLAPDLIRFANTLPDGLKHAHGQDKRILRLLARMRGLPESIVTQRKQGFTFPIARWLKTTLKAEMAALLLCDAEWNADGLVDPARIRALYSEHLGGRRNHYRLLYHLMVFMAWRRRYANVDVAPTHPGLGASRRSIG